MRELIPVVVPDVTLPVFILWEFMLVFILWCFIRVLVAPGPTLPSLDAPGAGWVCAGATDETAIVEAQRRAEAAEALLRGVFETSLDLIVVTDRRGTLIRISEVR